MEKCMIFLGIRAVARRARSEGALSSKQYRQFRLRLWGNQGAGDEVLFSVRLVDEVLAAAAFSNCSAVSVGPEGPVIDSLIDLLNWMLENWELIAKIILFLLSL